MPSLLDLNTTMPMKVDNTGFMVDRLGQDCSPLQFLRELTQNSIEAILALPDPQGQILWDVEWEMFADTGVCKLCITDTGIGMTGDEMVQYINHLSSSIHEQSLEPVMDLVGLRHGNPSALPQALPDGCE